MRDWHHRIIKLNEALALINNNNRIVIAVREDDIELEELTVPLYGLKYKAKSRGLFKIINGVQKASLLGITIASPVITPNVPFRNVGSHSTCVSGIILGNKNDSDNNPLPISGIIENAELINVSSVTYSQHLLFTLDSTKYYANKGSLIINPLIGLVPSLDYIYDNNIYIPPNKQASIINFSITVSISNAGNVALYDVLFKTVKAYGNKGRGVLYVAGAGNSNEDTINIQDYGKYFSYPLIISAATIDNSIPFEEVNEIRSPYSCFGSRVDMCGPSNGGKNGIYSSCKVRCGEIGYADEVIIKNITATGQAENDNLTLVDTHQLFPGNCVEIGIPGDIHHEVLIIDKVIRSQNKITFLKDRYYTANPFTISPATVRIPILTATATIVEGTNNKFKVDDNRGLGYDDQEICIFNGTAYHYAKITAVDTPNQFEFNPVLPAGYARTNLQVTPGQVTAYVSSYNAAAGETTFDFPANQYKKLSSFFPGGKVAVIDTSGGTDTILTVSNIKNTVTQGIKSITLEKYQLDNPDYTSLKLVSVGYGSYTSSFGGTSAATPVVSGVAGLLQRANPDLNVLEIKHILKTTADKINLKESNSTGRWKDAAGSNISYSSVPAKLTQATVIGNNEIFVDALSSFNVNDAVEISGNFRSVIEKKLSDRLVLQLGVTAVYSVDAPVKKGQPPVHSQYYGTGRVNAKRAVQLALDWHDATPTQEVQKPKLFIADRMNPDGSILSTIHDTDTDQTVSSPDIWVKPIADASTTVPTVTELLNKLSTADDQKIYVRIRNQGNRESFKECDLRVYIAFTDDINPAFPFPSKWYDQDGIKLLAFTEIPVIASNGEVIVALEWKNIAAFWNTNNPIDPTTTKRKRAYLMAHIAPFDGEASEVQLNNVRNNKQLTYKEIIVTHNGVSDRTAYLPGNKVDIAVTSQPTIKSYDLIMENVSTAIVGDIAIKATKTNDVGPSEIILYSKAGGTWHIESGSGSWIAFDTPSSLASPHAGYENMKFPYTISVNQNEAEVKLEIINP